MAPTIAPQIVPITMSVVALTDLTDAGLRDEHRGKDRPIPLRQCEYRRQRIGKKPGHSHVDAPPEHCCIGGGPTAKVTPQLHASALS